MTTIHEAELNRLGKTGRRGRSTGATGRELRSEDRVVLRKVLTELMLERGDSAGPTVRYAADGIRLSPAMLTGSGFRQGDRFRCRTEADRIVLERLQ